MQISSMPIRLALEAHGEGAKSVRMTAHILGPFLSLDHATDAVMHLAATFIAPQDRAVPPVVINGRNYAAEKLAKIGNHSVHRARFTLCAKSGGSYDWDGTCYPVRGAFDADMRIAFVSCNGEEHGDLERDSAERNALWGGLCEQHRKGPFSLLLHGGDQIYVDEATQGHPLSAGWPENLPKDPPRADLEDLRDHLREKFLERYAALWGDPRYGWLVARVPSMTQWDDHDICDGWGSLPREATYSPVGQTLFSVAREMTLLFQHGTVEGDLPKRFEDPKGLHLGWTLDLPDLRIIAPDLRGERTRREVMGQGGWRMMEDVAARRAPARSLLISSVPLLGPRLSIVEALMVLTPKMQEYEDDLRDQWQSRAHRKSWRRMLLLVSKMMKRAGHDVTVLSGELHLATRSTLEVLPDRVLHQLVSSGVAHRPPPRLYARVLGLLSTLPESPLKGTRITTRRIPGQKSRYVADRNALILSRVGTDWQAQWLFESSGLTPGLPI